ncbi:MAG: hypothetical protein DHS20C11_29240 [Lysobacteraceae bacterium]|nr:MAG: hypothetical protein DHS20C11_29240 [Xanthomonadaceae bacterium]
MPSALTALGVAERPAKDGRAGVTYGAESFRHGWQIRPGWPKLVEARDPTSLQVVGRRWINVGDDEGHVSAGSRFIAYFSNTDPSIAAAS